MKSRGVQILLAVMVLSLLAFALRIYHLEARSIASDEISLLSRAQLPLARLLQPTLLEDGAVSAFAPPLYPLLLAATVRLAGSGDFVLRYLSVVWSLLSVVLLYALAARWWNRRSGVLAAVLATLSPLSLTYARRAGPHSMAGALALLAIYALERAFQPGGRRWLAVALASILAAVATSYAALAVLPVMAVQVLLHWQARRARLIDGLLAGVGLLLTVLLLVGYRYGLSLRPLAGPGLSRLVELWCVALRDLTLGGSLLAQRTWPLELIALVLLLAGGFFPAARGNRAQLWAFVAMLMWVGPALVLLWPGWNGATNLLLVLSPACYLGMARGVERLAQHTRPLGVMAGVAVVTGMIFSAPAHYAVVSTSAEADLRAVATMVESYERSGDIVLLGNAQAAAAFSHYYGGKLPAIELVDLAAEGTEPVLQPSLSDFTARYQRLWLIGENDSVASWLDAHAFLIERAAFPSESQQAGLRLYLTRTPCLAETPPNQHPRQVSFGQLRLEGYDLPLQSVAGGERAWVTLYWRSLQPGRSIGVSLRLLDSQGHLWARSDQIPYPAYPSQDWPAGIVIRHEASLYVPPGVPPGWYRLELRLYDPVSGRPIDPLPEDAPVGALALGPLRVEATMTGRDVLQWLRAKHGLIGGGGIQFGDTLVLRACGTREARVSPGEYLHADLYWQVQLPPDQELVLSLIMLDSNGQVVAQQSASPVSADYTALQWRSGELLWAQHDLLVPGNLSPGAYTLHIGVRTVNGQQLPVRNGWRFWSWGGATAGLARIQVLDTPPLQERPTMERSLDIRSTAGIELLGCDGPGGRLQAGGTMPLTLYWRALGTPGQSYKVSVQLLAADGRTVLAQRDTIPGGWEHPTTSWTQGQVVVDTHELTVPAGTLPQDATVILVLYDEDTGRRAQWLDGNAVREQITLTRVEVVP